MKKFENYCRNLAVLSLAGQQDLEYVRDCIAERYPAVSSTD